MEGIMFWIASVLFLGLLWGSFLALLVYRIPKNISIIKPRSFCDNCLNPLKLIQNIPVVSFFVYKGLCPKCSFKIPLKYLIIELLTSVLFLLTYIYVYTDIFSLIRSFLLITAIVPSVFIDFDEMIIPDRFSIGLIISGFVLSFFDPMMTWQASLLGIIVGGGVLYLIALFYYYLTGNEGLGGGDVKLFAGIGSIFGWYGVLNVMFYSSILGSFIGIIFLIISKKSRKTAIPFGPFIGVTALIYYFLSESGLMF